MALDAHLAAQAARQVTSYPFKVWGFGEEIALKALIEYSDVSGDRTAYRFAQRIVGEWCATLEAPTPADHVAPGAVILELFERTGDEHLLVAARLLGQQQLDYVRVEGIPLHRPEHPQLELGSLIWVDCLALDAPFLTRLALATGESMWRDLALESLTSYCRVLFDEAAGLYRHGFDTSTRRQSPCNWARGNGWALHGLVDTLEMLPRKDTAFATLSGLLAQLTGRLLDLQHESGLWHTILDDQDSPLENSTAVLYASGLLKAKRLALIPSLNDVRLHQAIERAIVATRAAIDSAGRLPVSFATPVGERSTYVNAPQGVYPWGQGPLLLTHVELERARSASVPNAGPGAEGAQSTAARLPKGNQR